MSTAIDSSRRLALRLHALHTADRAWILSQMPAEAKARLEPLLGELDDLGFSIDQQMVDALDAHADDRGPASERTGEYERHIQALDRAPAGWIVEQLQSEPPAVLDCLLSIHPWSWAHAVKPSVNFEEALMQGAVARPKATPRVHQILLRQMARTMPAEFPESAVAAPPANTEAPASYATSAIERIRETWRRLPWKR